MKATTEQTPNAQRPTSNVERQTARFFVGAKNDTGAVIVAEIVYAATFYEALTKLRHLAEAAANGATWHPTAVNEWPALCARGSELEHIASGDPALAGGLR